MSNVNIITTKLLPPSSHTSVIKRDRVLQKLNEAGQYKLALISAPAGFGKTTLAGQWFHRRRQAGEAVCWLSLDNYDSDPVTFLIYFVAAIRTLHPKFGTTAVSLLTDADIRKLPGIVAGLVNELEAIPQNILLFLDDYSRACSDSMDMFIEWFLENLPANLSLVIMSRTFPSRLLPTLRMHEDLLEINIDDLRFDETEASEYLNQVKGLGISPAAMTILYERSEGWAAGLQLSSLLMRDTGQAEVFINSFSGTLRDISDYLASEVLAAQEEPIREFMLRSAVLMRMSGKACDYILQIKDSQKNLRELESKNLFIVPLDENREWYRYHTLFREFLLEQLQINFPGTVEGIYQRAADWCRKSSLLNEAVNYAVLAGDENKVTEIMQLGSLDKLAMYGNISSFNAWIDKIPGEIRSNNLRFLIADCFTLAHRNQLDMAGQTLQQLQEYRRTTARTQGRDVSGEENLTKAEEEMLMLAIKVAYMADDVDAVKELSTKTLGLQDDFSQGFVCRMKGYACLSRGELKQAGEKFMEGLIHHRNADAHQSVAVTNVFLALVYFYQCRHQDAMKLLDNTELLATNIKYGSTYPLASIRVMRAVILYDMHRLDEAQVLLEDYLSCLDHNGHIIVPALGYITLAKCHAAQGNYTAANLTLKHLADLAAVVVSDRITAMIDSIKVLLSPKEFAQKNKIDSYLNTVNQASTDWEHGNSFKIITACRMLMVANRIEEALELVEKLQRQAEATGACHNQLECLVLKSCMLKKLEQDKQAVSAMMKALELSQAEGCMRLFIEEGETALSVLLMAMNNKRPLDAGMQEYSKMLRSKFFQLEKSCKRPTHKKLSGSENSDDMENLEFSPREQEVLNLLAAGKPNYLIADSLSISENTVKFHVKNIFNKLKVRNRAAAVAKANKEGMLTS